MLFKYLFKIFLSLIVLSNISLFAQNTSDISELSLEELMNLEITTASNSTEKLSEAPATTIVITKEDIYERGYTTLSEFFDDLPGMDVTKAYGDTYFANYLRGYRFNIGSPYLIMVDGIIFNHLYYNTSTIMEAFSLSNIERIEIVYGPASSVYGPNAFMGVINVITKKDVAENGSFITANLNKHSFSSTDVDVNMFYKKDDFRVSLSIKIDNGDIDEVAAANYEYTNPKYLADRSLWGGLLDNPNITGSSSPHHNRALDFRVFSGDLELGFQHYSLKSGYGLVYPTDKVQTNSSWTLEETSLYLRQTKQLNDNFTSKTLVRYRTSNVPNDSFFLEGYNSGNKRVVDFSYWQTLNSSWSVYQDFNITFNENLSIVAGLKYEEKDLQKAYDASYGPSLEPSEITSYPYPDVPLDIKQQNNRIVTEDKGIYVQARYQMNEDSTVHIGIRNDNNSVYGSSTVFRGGYVQKIGDLVVKLLYGEAFQEPVPRLLYGGWQGSGSDPDLTPEKSKTYEFSLSKTSEKFSNFVSVYYVKSSDTILNISAGAVNLGQRNVYGLDYHFKAIIPVEKLKQFKVWAYYSYINAKGDEIYDSATDSYMEADIGDIADHKFYFGATALFDDHWMATLRGRYIGKRDTVYTNPVGSVDSYVTADLNIVMKDYFVKGWGISLKVTNLLDTNYSHPGMREADAGITQGYWDEENNWVGSSGWYNSLMPQPGRAFYLTLNLRY